MESAPISDWIWFILLQIYLVCEAKHGNCLRELLALLGQFKIREPSDSELMNTKEQFKLWINRRHLRIMFFYQSADLRITQNKPQFQWESANLRRWNQLQSAIESDSDYLTISMVCAANHGNCLRELLALLEKFKIRAIGVICGWLLLQKLWRKPSY